VTEDRTISEVLQDILRNLQEIVRSEVRLAKAEIRVEATQAASTVLWVAAGAVSALCCWMFLSWAAVYALAMFMSMWAATLVVAGVLAIMASVLLIIGVRRFRRIQPIPERTVEALKENLEWMKQSTR
jgi:hypothetical protein